MSYQSGMAALNLRFTDRVPRTEYSAHGYHWPLIREVTGIDTDIEANRESARKEFIRIWDYAFLWSTPGGHKITVKTDMGHAEYADDGADKRKVGSCPFKSVDEVLRFRPDEVFPHEPMDAIVRWCDDWYTKAHAYWGDISLPTGGIYHTLFSGLIEIFGWDLLLEAGAADPAEFAKVIDSYGDWIERHWNAWAKSKAPVIMSHDDICWTHGPVFAPDWYRKYIFPWYKKFWTPLKEAGRKVIFTSDGTYHIFFDDIVAAGADCLVMEPTTDMAMFAEKYGRTHGFVGNADTRILLSGTKDDIYAEVKRCMDIGKKYPGFIMAVGNHIPANTPVDSALYYNEAYMKLSKR
ncbi:MAG: hypothetical protein HZA50_15590 [Planctomycetes bacterium]|nr:hypothetical protein [Planctomycetota bacterium]